MNFRPISVVLKVFFVCLLLFYFILASVLTDGICKCPSLFYLTNKAGIQICDNCNDKCENCDGPGNDECISCHNNYEFSSGKCVST